MARQLLRQESLASSRIEGLLISHKRIGEAGYDPRGTADQRAREVLANIEAMEQAIRVGSAGDAITAETIVDLHCTLLGVTQPKIAGHIRDGQGWIGGLASHHVPPVSLLMATDVDGYVKALTSYRGGDESDWTTYFAETTIAASAAAEEFGERLADLQAEWRAKAQVRRGSTAEKVIDALQAQPVIDVKTAAELAGTSEEAARLALNSLAERGVLKQVTKRNWGRVWEAKGLWNLLDRFEERLATPVGQHRPGRPAPRTR